MKGHCLKTLGNTPSNGDQVRDKVLFYNPSSSLTPSWVYEPNILQYEPLAWNWFIPCSFVDITSSDAIGILNYRTWSTQEGGKRGWGRWEETLGSREEKEKDRIASHFISSAVDLSGVATILRTTKNHLLVAGRKSAISFSIFNVWSLSSMFFASVLDNVGPPWDNTENSISQAPYQGFVGNCSFLNNSPEMTGHSYSFTWLAKEKQQDEICPW